MGWGELPATPRTELDQEKAAHEAHMYEWEQEHNLLRQVRDLIRPPSTTAQREEALGILDHLLEEGTPEA